MRRVPLRFILALGVAACAHRQTMNPANVQMISAVQTDVRAAQQAGADKDQRAAHHVTLANRQVAEAQRLSNDGNQRGASQLLHQAKADAELALAIAREVQVRREAEETRARISELEARVRVVEPGVQPQEVTP